MTEIQATCRQVQRALSSAVLLPQVTDNVSPRKYIASTQAILMLKRSPPSMLDRWVPVDGNSMFRVISQAVFHTQDYHMQLCVLACLEVEYFINQHTISLAQLSRFTEPYILLPPTYADLWTELCMPGPSCCYAVLVVLSVVLQLC